MNRLLSRKLRRDLGRRRAQVLAVAASVALGVAIFVISSGLAGDLGASYDETYDRTAFADVWATGDPAALQAAASGVDGVERVEVRTSGDIGATFDQRSITTRIVGFAPDTQLNRLVAEAGDVDGALATPAPPGRQGVVVERHAAEHFGLAPGDTIEIAGYGPVEVEGVATSPEWLWVSPSQQELVVDPDDFAVVFAPEQLAAEVAPEGSNQVVVAVDGHSPATADEVAAALLLAGAVEVFTRATHPSHSALQADLDGFAQVAAIVPLLFLGAAALSAAVLLGRLITQQQAEIGMMRANGFSTPTLVCHYGLYGVVIAAGGALVGIPLGIAGSRAASSAYAGIIGVPFASHTARPVLWVIGLAVATAVGAAAGSVPARLAAAVDPASAMRPGGATEAGRRSWVERLLPGQGPSWLVVAARNLNRQPRRAATTGLGIVLSLVLCVTGLVLNDTISGVVDRQYGEVDRRELVVTLERPADADLVADVMDVPGVATAERYAETGAAVLAGGEIAPVNLQVFEPGTALHGFDDPLGDGGLVLPATTAEQLGVVAGDRVELRAGAVQAELPLVQVVDEPFGGSGYLSVSAWAAVGGAEPSAIGVILDDRAQHAAVADRLDVLDGSVRVNDIVATGERARQLLAAAAGFAAIILVLAVAMAVALIFNALTVTVGERETEVATLQANGVGRRWIRRAITSENLLAVVAAMIPGLVLGRLSAGWFVGQFSTEQITFDPVLRPWSLVLAVALVIGAALVSQVPGLRRLDRLELAVKVRERAL